MARTYVGRRLDGAERVDVYGPDGVTPLDDHWSDPVRRFGWGDDLLGSVALARALLSNVFGVATTEDLALTFAAEVISSLPEAGFALGEEEVRRWLTPPRDRKLTADELVEHLGGIALADQDDAAELLRRVVERCWDDRTLRH